MATESVSASEFNDLAARYEALERQANNLLAAMSRGRAIRNYVVLVLLVMIGVLIGGILQMHGKITSPKFHKQLAEEAQARMQNNSTEVQKQITLLYEKSNPAVMKAFQAQAEKDQAKFVAAAEKEWPKFKDDFEKRVEERVREQYKTAITEMRPQLEEIAPELKDQAKYDKLQDGLVSAAERSVMKMVKDDIEPRFVKLETNWRSYPEADKPGPNDPSIGMQIVGHAMELLAVAFAKGDGLAAFIETPEQKQPHRISPPPTRIDQKTAPNGASKADSSAKKGG